ncbi:hypothetical protein J3Q64DRAFT_1426891 [Phycomyces blakesleeanus]|uniref:Uncharacterized protein n=1 Tax=Phycomyces blakesleeanus TaxID=4837 RepID=A0ABR3AI36_PHYBL
MTRIIVDQQDRKEDITPATPTHTTISPNDDDEGLYLLWTHQLLREHGFKPSSCRTSTLQGDDDTRSGNNDDDDDDIASDDSSVTNHSLDLAASFQDPNVLTPPKYGVGRSIEPSIAPSSSNMILNNSPESVSGFTPKRSFLSKVLPCFF